MMGTLSTFFKWGSLNQSRGELPDLFPLGMTDNEFIRIDTENIYSKILTDVIERTQGIPDKALPFLWDNCLQSESNKGLISLLSEAMAEKKDLYLIFKSEVLRKATNEEAQKIREDYEKVGKSSLGVFISFKHYLKSDMVRLYSALEYCVVSALNKSMNLSKAIQFKMSDLRGSVSLTDKGEVKEQARGISESLSRGKDVLLDAKDEIITAMPDLTAIKESLRHLDAKRCFYLGMPMSYVNGDLPKGLGDTGEADSKAIERGLKNYYFSVIKPSIETVFQIKTTFKSQDFRQIGTALEALKTFELISDEYISPENKLLIINKLLDVDSDLGDAEEKEIIVRPDEDQEEDDQVRTQ